MATRKVIALLVGTARAARIAETVGKLYSEGVALPEIRKALAADPKLGGTPSLYLGTADPIYYRLVGLANPLSYANGKPLAGADAKPESAAFRKALRRRRDSGVRWNVLAASAEATSGLRISETVAKRLYAKAGGDLASSYVGRGTRVGAPTTYGAPEAAVEGKSASAK